MKKKRPGMAHFYKKIMVTYFAMVSMASFASFSAVSKKQFNNNGEEISMQIPMLGLELTTSHS